MFELPINVVDALSTALLRIPPFVQSTMGFNCTIYRFALLIVVNHPTRLGIIVIMLFWFSKAALFPKSVTYFQLKLCWNHLIAVAKCILDRRHEMRAIYQLSPHQLEMQLMENSLFIC